MKPTTVVSSESSMKHPSSPPLPPAGRRTEPTGERGGREGREGKGREGKMDKWKKGGREFEGRIGVRERERRIGNKKGVKSQREVNLAYHLAWSLQPLHVKAQYCGVNTQIRQLIIGL